MSYAKVLVLHAPLKDHGKLEHFVADCIRDEVHWICVVGTGCEALHDAIDTLIIGDGADTSGYDIVTTWHDGETLAEVVSFARSVRDSADVPLSVQEVML